MTVNKAPDAKLLIAPGCVHCPVVLAALAELVKQGAIGRLEVVNIVAHPEIAQTLGVRGVPWISIGPFELSGAHTQGELAAWAARAGDAAGRRAYLEQSLGAGQLDSVIAACRRNPELLAALLQLAADIEAPYAARIGVGAVLEDLAPDGLLSGLVGELAVLADSPHPQVRADAAHFLGLSGAAEARDRLTELAADEDNEVREIASESLDLLAEAARRD
jgi:hypothetical protein